MEVPRATDTDLLHFQSWPSPLYRDRWLIAPHVPPPGKDSSFILIALMWSQSTCLLFVAMCPSLLRNCSWYIFMDENLFGRSRHFGGFGPVNSVIQTNLVRSMSVGEPFT